MEKRDVRAITKFYFLKGKTATQIKSKLDANIQKATPSLGSFLKLKASLSDSRKIEKQEIRSVIKYYFLKGKTTTQIKGKLDAVLGKATLSFKTVHTWVVAFKGGRTSCKDKQRSGRPNEVTCNETKEKLQNIILADSRLKIRQIAEITKISTERVHNILHEHLRLKKCCSRWVPRLLTSSDKQVRIDFSSESLSLFHQNPNNFLRRLITVGEIWIHYYSTEPTERTNKILATVFWDSQGIILIEYFQQGKTNTDIYYANLLERLGHDIKEKRPHFTTKKVLFYHDNAPTYTSPNAMAKIHELKFELLKHSPYSPDLAPSDFYLFPTLNKWLVGKKFANDSEVIYAVNGYFNGLDESFYKSGLMALEDRWSKCIELKGDYVEN